MLRLNRFTINQRLLLGVGLLLVQLLIIAAIAVYSMLDTSSRLRTINEAISPRVEAENKKVVQLAQVLGAVGNIGLLSTPEDVEREFNSLKDVYRKYEEDVS